MSDEEWDVALEDLEDDADATAGSLSIPSLVNRALSDLGTKSAGQLVVAMLVVSLLTAVCSQTILVRTIRFVQANAPAAQASQLPDPATFPLSVDAPQAVIVLLSVLLLVLPFVSEAIRVVAIRTIYAGEYDGISRSLARRNLPRAVFRGWLGGFVLVFAVSLGVALLIVPGLFLAVSMAFYHQEVSVADESIRGALTASWDRTRGHRWEVLGLLGVVVAISLAPTGLPFLFSATSPAGPLVTAVLSPVTTLFAMALFTEAYADLRESDSAEA